METMLYAENGSPTTSQPSPLVSLAPLLVIFVIFYFLLIRPQQKKMKTHKKMLDDLKKGDMIITSSGFYGTVVGLGDTSLELKLADNVKVKMLKSSISEVLTSPEISTANIVKS